MKVGGLIVPLILGVAIGFGACLWLSSRPKHPEEPVVEQKVRQKIADKGEEATVKALRARIAVLEKALAEKPAPLATTNAVAAAGENRWNPQRRLEELKEKDPARYTQITNRMAQWRQRQFERAQSKLDFLASVDTSRMSAGARKVHSDLQAAIVSQEELEQRLQDPNLTPDERKALFMEMHESRGRLADLSRRERNNLLGETARELGFSGEDAKTITATIRDVIEATDAGWGGHGHHGRGRGPRGEGGPPSGGKGPR